MKRRCECGRPAVCAVAGRWKFRPQHWLCPACFERAKDSATGGGAGMGRVKVSKELAAKLLGSAGSPALKPAGKRKPSAGSVAAASVAAYCRAKGYPEPMAEVEFHPTRRWRFDLCWGKDRLALEFHGGSWVGGRHTRGAGFESDLEKNGEAILHGWRVLAVTHQQMKAGLLWEWLDRLFGAGTPAPVKGD